VKIIGHTSSGKPVYAAFQFHRGFDDWTANDHNDAADLHRDALLTDIKTNVSMHKTSAALHDEEAQRIHKLVEKLGLGRTAKKPPRHSTRKKSSAELDREIAQVLAKKSRRGRSAAHATRSKAASSWEEIAVDERARLHHVAAGHGGAPRIARSGGARAAHATKKDFDWSSFTDGAAYGLWASPYMSEVSNLADESREAYRALSPGSGGKWDDVIPEPAAAAVAVAKKFTKTVKDKLTDEQLSELAAKYSAYDAGYYGAMQSQGEGVGWFDKGVRLDPPDGFDSDPKIQNAIDRAIRKGAREAGVKLPR